MSFTETHDDACSKSARSAHSRQSVVIHEGPDIIITAYTPQSEEEPPMPPMTPMGTMGTLHTTGTQLTREQRSESIYGPAPSPNRLVDQVPRARHTVDYQDMLWTQIDILDDVRKMAEQTRSQGSFFSREHSEAMESLRESQIELLSALQRSEDAMERDNAAVWGATTLDEVRGLLYDREYLECVQESLVAVKKDLSGVGDTMRRLN